MWYITALYSGARDHTFRVTRRVFKGSPDTQWRGDPTAANISTSFLIMSVTPNAEADSSGLRQRGEV